MTKKIAFTGGGSIGHVAVNVALIPYFQQQGYDTFYIGSHNGIEREMIKTLDHVDYFPISSGKLRRYFDWKNFTDPFKVIKGVWDAYRILKQQQPNIIFSKGGFVSVPVAIAAKLCKIPIVLHESDLTPGLANKISMKFADHLFVTFSQTATYFPKDQVTIIGSIIRENLFSGSPENALQFTGLSSDKPTLLVMGGSLGSQALNTAIRNNLSELLKQFQIIHLTGKGLLDDSIQLTGYVQYEFLTDELTDILALSDYVISRAGANSIFEFLALSLPMLLIPLSEQASRGDQVLNADYFEKQGYAIVLQEENLTNETLLQEVHRLVIETPQIKNNMVRHDARYSIKDFYQFIVQFEKK